jgi:hypothetical protein
MLNFPVFLFKPNQIVPNKTSQKNERTKMCPELIKQDKTKKREEVKREIRTVTGLRF